MIKQKDKKMDENKEIQKPNTLQIDDETYFIKKATLITHGEKQISFMDVFGDDQVKKHVVFVHGKESKDDQMILLSEEQFCLLFTLLVNVRQAHALTIEATLKKLNTESDILVTPVVR